MASRYFTPGGHDVAEERKKNKIHAEKTKKDDESTGSADDEDQDVEKILRKEKEDPFSGPAPIPEEKVASYKRGKRNESDGIEDVHFKGRIKSIENKFEHAANQAARYELLLPEEAGFLEPEEGEETYAIDQQEIKKHVDIASANKQFELNLKQFGPYRMSYTRNGRYLLLGGHRGHVAAFDWTSKKLMCEMNVMEMVNDVKWLHTENMFAVAQRKWVYIYDNQGIELHCLKSMHESLRLEFLPYHFLLVASCRNGFLHYLDISVGKNINSFPTRGGRLSVMTQNPHNAVILLGHYNGTVTMRSPMMKEPLVKMLCHKNAVRSVAVDKSGVYMATSGQDRRMKIFDIRMYSPVHAYSMMCPPSNLTFSQRGLLGATCSNVVEVYKDPCRQLQDKPYLVHSLKHPACDLEFCPYEDVLGVGREDGFESLLVPGAGEANFDALESNPYQSKTQRKEWEVKALLEKIQPDMISLDPFQIGNVDHVTAGQLRKDKEERMGFKSEEAKFEPKFKKKGKSSAGNVQKRKQVVRNAEVREKIKKDLQKKKMEEEVETKNLAKHSRPTKPIANQEPDNINQPIIKKPALSRFKKR